MSKFLEELAADALNKVMEKQHRDAALSIGPFLELPRPLQRRVLQLLLLRLYGGVPPTLTSVHIGHILMLCERGRPSGMIDLPKGLKVIRSYDRCLFTFDAESGEKGYWFELPVPALLPLPNGYAIISEFGEHYPRKQAGNDWFVVDPASVSLPLRVRTRRRGDRMVLKGTGGTKKLKEIFIEAKTSADGKGSLADCRRCRRSHPLGAWLEKTRLSKRKTVGKLAIFCCNIRR